MTVKIITKKFTLTDDVKEKIEKKLRKFDKFFPADTTATVALSSIRNWERVEITIFKGGSIFRAEEQDEDYLCALDRAVEVLERQIRKNRTRLEKQLHIRKEDFQVMEREEPEEQIAISKYKKFELLPMSVEEAVLQMNLLSHNFFMFRNAETGLINVVYKRRENDYGVIEPTE